ncbi:hypothetical protein OKW44_001348 [Paraburkholderia sp. WSM4174]
MVPGGGIAPDGEHWIACRPGFFLPVRVLSRLFRRLFLEQLRRAFDTGTLHFYGKLEPLADAQAFAAFLGPAVRAEWVVYAKPPFGDARHVLDYLGRYTHRVAISNNRLMRFDGDDVTFLWKDYKHGATHKTMTLTADEFIRCFLLHVLPDGFKHIRSYGLLANCHRAARLATCRRLLGGVAPAQETSSVTEDYRDRFQRLTGRSLRDCPACGKGHMVASKPFCPAHCRVHRHTFTMITDPLWRDCQSRFHSFLVATHAGLRQRVFAVYPRPGIYVSHLARNTFAPPSRDRRLRFIVARRPADVCGARWMTAATIQCP